MLWIQLIGAFFALEGGANVIYWAIYGVGIADNKFWQLGRVLRMALGLILVLFG